MTDGPYTDEDLRAEAARQHAITLMDPDFMGIGECMDGTEIESTYYDQAGQRHENGRTWDQLSREDFDAAQRAIDDLLTKAADVSDWAINLGADGLEADEHELTWSAGQQPIVRVHFAFHPDMSDEARDELVRQVGEAVGERLHTAAEDASE